MERRRIGVVVHGPEIIDSGWAKRIICLLERRGEVTSLLGGTMGRTAVIDASLEDLIDITKRLKPSESIKMLSGEASEMYLLNYGKSMETGHAFGRIVMHNVGELEIPLVQIERPGDADGTVVPWTSTSKELAEIIAKDLGLDVKTPPQIEKTVRRDADRVFRKLSGVYTGELILVNGVVVGRATSRDVEIVTEAGHICEIIGGEVKEHGLEKIKEVDIESAIIKTGLLRRSKARPRVLDRKNNSKGCIAVIIDHCAEESFEICKGADIAITVGDDTTDIAGDVMYRFGVPIIGITDGDLDKVVRDTHITPGSTVIRLKSGTDDIVGIRIKEEIFKGKDSITIDDMEEFRERIFEICKGAIEDVRTY